MVYLAITMKEGFWNIGWPENVPILLEDGLYVEVILEYAFLRVAPPFAASARPLYFVWKQQMYK